jgi:hypothetical protein
LSVVAVLVVVVTTAEAAALQDWFIKLLMR